MTEKDQGTRPSQVTMAGWVALIGSALLVVSLFDSVSRLHTLEFRDSIDEFLSTPPGNGMGLTMGDVVEILRALMLFSGAAAAAATVLAVFVLQRHNAARVGFTIAAAAILLTAPVSGGFLAVMIAFAATMLWTRPARDWFAGRPVTQAPSTRSGSRPEAFAAHDPRHRMEGNLVTSESDRPQDRPDRSDEETSPWPRMPEGSTGRPVPPPTQGFGSPSAEHGEEPGRPGQPGEPQQGSAPQGQPQQGQPQQGQGAPGYGGAASPTYGQQPSGGQPPYGQPGQGSQPPYGQTPYGQPGQGSQAPYGQAPYGQPGQGSQPPYGQAPYGQPSYGRPAYGQQAPYGYPGQYSQPYGAPQQVRDPDQRPTTVTVAVWITWVLSALSILFFVLMAFVMAAARDEFVRQLEQDADFQALNIQADQVVVFLWVLGAVTLFWGIAAMVLAWFAYRRANWARITLVVSSAVTALLSLVSFPVGLLHTLGAGAVIALLFLGGANEWYSRRDAVQGYQPGPFQPYGQPPQYGGPAGGQYGGSGQYGAQPPQYGAPQPPQSARPAYGEQPPSGGDQGGTPSSGQPDAQGAQDAGLPEAQEPPREGRRHRKDDEPPSNVW